ncbi:MAG: hypothetical protein J6Q89_04060 [Clostridia bacterium]|nr:hypothetical protein [Clostridia bacterium]
MKNTNEEMEYTCLYCEHAVVIRETNICICKHNGAVDQNDTCGKFMLDLLKLAPMTRKLPEEDTLFVEL